MYATMASAAASLAALIFASSAGAAAASCIAAFALPDAEQLFAGVLHEIQKSHDVAPWWMCDRHRRDPIDTVVEKRPCSLPSFYSLPAARRPRHGPPVAARSRAPVRRGHATAIRQGYNCAASGRTPPRHRRRRRRAAAPPDRPRRISTRNCMQIPVTHFAQRVVDPPRLVGGVAHCAAPHVPLDRDRPGARRDLPRVVARRRVRSGDGADRARGVGADAGRDEPAERRRLHRAAHRKRRPRRPAARHRQRLAHAARGEAGDPRHDRDRRAGHAAGDAPVRLADRADRRWPRRSPPTATWADRGPSPTRRSASSPSSSSSGRSPSAAPITCRPERSEPPRGSPASRSARWPRPCCWSTTIATAPTTSTTGRRTLAVVIGAAASVRLYAALELAPFALAALLAWVDAQRLARAAAARAAVGAAARARLRPRVRRARAERAARSAP